MKWALLKFKIYKFNNIININKSINYNEIFNKIKKSARKNNIYF